MTYKERIQRRWLIVIAVALLIFIVGLFFYGKPAKSLFVDDAIVKADKDSVQKLDNFTAERIRIINERIDRDSIQLASIKDLLLSLPATLTKINQQYDKKNADYRALPFDRQFVLFAAFLNEIDTIPATGEVAR